MKCSCKETNIQHTHCQFCDKRLSNRKAKGTGPICYNCYRRKKRLLVQDN